MVKRWRMVYGHLTIGISDKGYINPYEWMTIHPDGHIIQLCPWHPRKCPAIQKKIQLACPNMFNQYQLGCTFESGWIYHDIIQKGKVVWGSNPFSWIFMLNGGLFLMFHEGLSQCVAITVTLKIWPVRLETNRAWSFVDLHRRWSNICASDLPKSIIYIYTYIYIYIWQYTHVSCPSYLQHPSWVFHHQSGPPSIDKCWWNHQQDGLVWELDTVPIKPWITTSFSHWHEPKMGPWGWDSPNVISSCGQFYYPIWFMFPGLSCSVKSELVYPIYIQFVVKYIPYYIYIHIYIIIYVFVHLFIYSVS